MTNIELAESFETKNRLGPTQTTLPHPTGKSFTTYFSSKREFLLILTQPSFKSWIDVIKTSDQYFWYLRNYLLFDNLAISVIFNFFVISFDWNFELWRFHWKDLVEIYQNIPYFKFKKWFLSIKFNFRRKIKFFRFIFVLFFSLKLLPKFSDFINSDDCIGKIT